MNGVADIVLKLLKFRCFGLFIALILIALLASRANSSSIGVLPTPTISSPSAGYNQIIDISSSMPSTGAAPYTYIWLVSYNGTAFTQAYDASPQGTSYCAVSENTAQTADESETCAFSVANSVFAPVGTYDFELEAYDSGVNAFISSPSEVYVGPVLMTQSNALITPGQVETYTIYVQNSIFPFNLSDTSDFNVELYNVTGFSGNATQYSFAPGNILPTGTTITQNQYVLPGTGNTFSLAGGSTSGTWTYAVLVQYEGTIQIAYSPALLTTTSANQAIDFTIVATNTTVDVGQNIIFFSSLIGNVGPYQYDYSVYNSVSNVVIANYLTPANSYNSNSFFLQITNSFISNSPIRANVVLSNIDGSNLHPNTTNLTINPALTTPTLTASNTPTVEEGQYELFTASFSSGSSPYVYNYTVINTITGAIIGNMLLTNALTSNTWFWQVPSTANSGVGNTISANIVVNDSATRNGTASSVNTPLINVLYSPPNIPVLTISNSLIDQGEGVLFTETTAGGTSPYNYAYNVYAYNSQSVSNVLIANMLFTSNTYTSNSWFWTPNPNLYVGNSIFQVNVVVVDAHPATANSLLYSFGYNSAVTSVSLISSNALVDQGQTDKLTYTIAGGTSPYTYNFVVTNTATGNVIANQIYTGVTTTTNSFTFVLPSSGGYATNALGSLTIKGNVIDSTSFTVGISNIISANIVAANAAVTTISLTSSNALIDQGQTETATYTISGGSGPYTYNFLVTNTATGNVIANQIYTSVTTTTNSFTFVLPSSGGYAANALGSLTVKGNVIDSTPFTPGVSNTISSTIIAANSAVTSTSLTQSNTLIDQGQTEVLTYKISGGSGPYTYNFLVTNTATGNVIANQVYTGVTTTTNSFTFVLPSSGGYAANALGSLTVKGNVIDSTTFTAGISNAISSNILAANSAVTSVSLTPSNTPVDQGQTETITYIISGGVEPYTYNFLVTNTATGNVIANQIYNGVTTTTNSFTFVLPSSGGYAANALGSLTIKGNVIDSTPFTPGISNTISSTTIAANSAVTSTSLTQSNTLIDQGQTEVLTFKISGESAPYTYNFLVTNTATGNVIANQIYTGVASPTNSFTFVLPSSGGYATNALGSLTIKGNAIDSTTFTAGISNTISSNAIAANAAVTFVSLASSNTIIDQGETETVTYTISGGSGSYTYNFLVTNTATGNVIANQIYTGVAAQANSFSFAIPSTGGYASNALGSLTVKANVLDSTPFTSGISNIISSTIIAANSAMSSLSLTSSNALIDQGQTETITYKISGGSGPYTYNFLVTNTATGNVIANQVYTSVATTSNSFSFVLPSAGGYAANAISSLTIKGNVIDSTPFTPGSQTSYLPMRSQQMWRLKLQH